MKSFAFEKNIYFGQFSGVKAKSSLSETMSLQDDYLVIQFLTEFESQDLIDVNEHFRELKP